MTKRILVINPNSTGSVTEGIDQSLAPLRMDGGPEIACLTLAEGPAAIESQAEVDAVVEPLCRRIEAEQTQTSAFVIACFSDPGLAAARELSRSPVYGIGEAAMATALTQGERFGILSILETSLPRHRRAIRARGLSERFAADLAIGVGVKGLSGGQAVFEKLRTTGKSLVEDHQADVVIMGCAGMARYRKELGLALGVPVVEPTQAATAMAIAAVQLDE